MDKPWYKSITILSAVAFAVLQTMEQSGVVPAGGTQAIVGLAQNVLIVLGTFGLRKAIG